jgi:phosphatidylglycerophosphate synthase
MLRSSAWVVAIGVLSVMAAAVLVRLFSAPGAWFVVLLIWCVGLVAGLAAVIAEITPGVGAAGGVFASALLAVLFGMTISAAPLGAGATRPGLRDLLWLPLLAVLAAAGLCAMSGFYGVRGGLHVARRRRT